MLNSVQILYCPLHAGIPSLPYDPLVGAAVEAALHCSVAVLAAAAPVSTSSETASLDDMLLVSTGKGDLVLLQAATAEASGAQQAVTANGVAMQQA